MGFRFQRSIRIASGLRINLSKSGIGVSAGVPGLRAGVDAKGRMYGSAGLPGTGLSYRATESQGQSSSGGFVAGLVIGIAIAIMILAALIGLVKMS